MYAYLPFDILSIQYFILDICMPQYSGCDIQGAHQAAPFKAPEVVAYLWFSMVCSRTSLKPANPMATFRLLSLPFQS